MRTRSGPWSFPVLLALPIVALACGALPPDFQLPQTITTIELGLIECPGGPPLARAVPQNLDCEWPAQVFDEFGFPIHEPSLVWRSSNTSILAASGGGKVGKLRGFIPGAATVTVGDRLGLVQTEVTVQVLSQR